MTNTQTKPQDVLGGTIGWLNEIGELATRGQGAFVNERPVSTPDFEQIVQMPEHQAANFPSRGSIEFNKKSDAKLIEAQRATIEEAARIVQQSKAKAEVENAVRLQMAGMSDEEKAQEGHYQEGYRGESLNSIYNYMDIFFRKVKGALEALKNKTKKPIEILSRRASSKAAVSGTNDLLFNASAQEGQSMISSASAVRGAG